MKHFFLLTIVLVMLFSAQTAYCQPIEIPLWSDGIPNQLPGLEGEKTIVDNGVVTHVSEVTQPTLAVYLAQNTNGKQSKAVIICPGGGYSRLSIEKEGHAVARFLSENGITGVVLKYRLPDDRFQPEKTLAPILDARQAIRVVRSKSKEWNLDSMAIGIMGFSAGGHLAATASTRQPYSYSSGNHVRPDFSILIYPVISMRNNLTHSGSRERLLGKEPCEAVVSEYSNELQVTATAPPTFMVHSYDDKAVPIGNTLLYAQKLAENKVECELHLYKSGGHGYGMNPGHTASWPQLMLNWIKTLQ